MFRRNGYKPPGRSPGHSLSNIPGRGAAPKNPPPQDRPELPGIERLQAVELRPGDMLIANVDRAAHATPETIDAVKQGLEDEFPGHEVLVLAGIDILVGRKPQEAP